MNTLELKQEQELIWKEIEKLDPEKAPNGIHPIYDGIIDYDDYVNSKYRIAWVLKEPYDEFRDGKPSGGGWSFVSGFSNINVYDDIKGIRTFYTMAYVNYAIFNGLSYADEDWIYDNPAIANTLREIAIINTSKFPEYTRTSPKSLYEKFDTWREINLRQLQVYKPQIVIFGGTFDLYAKDLELDKFIEYDKETYLPYAIKDGVLYIQAYHPAARVGRETYVHSISSLVDRKKDLIEEK